MNIKKQKPTEIKNHLLFDDALTFKKKGFNLTVNSPVRHGEPVLRAERPWEISGIHGDSNASVMKDGGRLRLWYAVRFSSSAAKGTAETLSADLKKMDQKTRHDFLSENRAMLCYAESSDGINWRKPCLNIFKYAGNGRNNIVWIDRLGATVFKDSHASGKESYKMIYGGYPRMPHVYRCDDKIPVKNIYCAVYGAYSPDGRRWKSYKKPVVPWYTDTTNVCYWDEKIGKYVAFVRWNENMIYDRGQTVIVKPGGWKYRAIGRTESPDFRKFPPPVKIMEPTRQEREPAKKGFDYYNTSAVKYPFAEDSYFMFSSNFYHDSDMLDVQLATSRDGVHYTRWHGPFLGTGTEGSFDSKRVYMATGLYRNNDEIWMYYVGMDHCHGVKEDADRSDGIGMARIRLDGFVSQDAGWNGGALMTIPFLFSGDKLTVNFDAHAGGWLKVELLDQKGKPILGFSRREADVLRGNNIRKTVTWKGRDGLASLSNKSFRINFIGRGLKLYSFQFVKN